MPVDGVPAADYRQVWRHTLLRLLLTYFAPLVLLAVYFNFQYHQLEAAARERHLVSIAESQATTLDLFLRERLVNLTNLADDPQLPVRPNDSDAAASLERLRRDSPAFVDLGFFDADGTVVAYAGPFPALREASYGDEIWFRAVSRGTARHVITDMYLGFRQEPHFTIAVRSSAPGRPAVVRATLDPERMYETLASLRGAAEVSSVLMSARGAYQTVTVPEPLRGTSSAPVPPEEPDLAPTRVAVGGRRIDAAYCWLDLVDWTVLVLWTGPSGGSLLGGVNLNVAAISAAVVLAVLSTVVIRARQVVLHQRAEDRARSELSGQLHHAARLASVGELAAGVAHEINNPLAIIAEESGLMRDELDFDGRVEPDQIRAHVDSIQEATFRARDITRKLLLFVRRSEIRVESLDLNDVVDDAVSGLLEHEMNVSNIEVERDYERNLPAVLADRGQIEQVVINLVTNAIDAIQAAGRCGRITLATRAFGETVRLTVSDTGTGIPVDQLARIFMPFHTTKEVGRGTGLGLSVSLGIVKGYGGDIHVDSGLGTGSAFTVVLPLQADASPPSASPEGSE